MASAKIPRDVLYSLNGLESRVVGITLDPRLMAQDSNYTEGGVRVKTWTLFSFGYCNVKMNQYVPRNDVNRFIDCFGKLF